MFIKLHYDNLKNIYINHYYQEMGQKNIASTEL